MRRQNLGGRYEGRSYALFLILVVATFTISDYAPQKSLVELNAKSEEFYQQGVFVCFLLRHITSVAVISSYVKKQEA